MALLPGTLSGAALGISERRNGATFVDLCLWNVKEDSVVYTHKLRLSTPHTSLQVGSHSGHQAHLSSGSGLPLGVSSHLHLSSVLPHPRLSFPPVSLSNPNQFALSVTVLTSVIIYLPIILHIFLILRIKTDSLVSLKGHVHSLLILPPTCHSSLPGLQTSFLPLHLKVV